MKDKGQFGYEPAWLDPSHDLDSAFSDSELEAQADDLMAGMADTKIHQDLLAALGQQKARAVLKMRLAAQNPNSMLKRQLHETLH